MYIYEFKTMIERQTRKFIKGLRTNNREEFILQDFLNYCTRNGIIWQFTLLYTFQQNGVVERRNRSILDKIRCILLSRRLSIYLWPIATKTKIYLSNRLLTRINNLNMSLKEMFSMNKPKLCHLKTFGCLSHVHIGHQSRNKLQSRLITCNFVGYDKQTKEYCIH